MYSDLYPDHFGMHAFQLQLDFPSSAKTTLVSFTVKTNGCFNYTVITQWQGQSLCVSLFSLCWYRLVENICTNQPERKLANVSSCTNHPERKLPHDVVFQPQMH